MTRPAATGPAESQQLPTRLLSATLAHELNNIVASLRGFVELGAEQSREHAALQRIFAEVRLGTERAAALAAELEVLAGAGSSTLPTPLLQCLAKPPAGRSAAGAPASDAPDIQWECDAHTQVLVDPVQAQLATSLLQRVGAGQAAPAPALRVQLAAKGAPADCASCGEPLPPRSAWLIQPLIPGRARQPRRAAPSRQHLSTAEWRLAVLSHAAHAAGGHIARQTGPDWLALVLPLA